MSEQGLPSNYDPVYSHLGLRPLSRAEWERYAEEAVRKLRDRGVPKRHPRTFS